MDDPGAWETALRIVPSPALRRRTARLPGYDYAMSGWYFVTVCLHDRAELLGSVRGGHLVPSQAGQMVAETWVELTTRFARLALDEYIVMPDHLHGILVLTGKSSEGARPGVGSIVGAFKSLSTHRYISGVAERGWPRFDTRLWQRGYYEHVVRNDS